jgi:hypothetical protein
VGKKSVRHERRAKRRSLFRCRSRFRAALEQLEARQLLAADVVINEIMFHAATSDPGHEFIELFNRGDQTANLASWKIDKGIDFTFPSATLAAGQYLVVAANVAKFQALYPSVTNVVGGWSGELSNSSNTIELLNNFGAVVDKVTYADSGDWAFRERGGGRDLIQSITRVGSTATVRIPDHGYQNGDTIQISGADQPEYNGTFTVSNVAASTFTITVSGSPATTATGHLIARRLTDLGHQGWSWTSLADGLGSSLELVNASLPNEFGQNWKFSTVWGGTPGAPNSTQSANIAPMVLNLQQTPVVPKSTDAVTISAKLVDEAGAATAATLYYRIDALSPPAFTNVPMHDDGLNGDTISGDGIWSAVIPPQAEGSVVEFYVSATDGTNTRTWPGPTDSLGTQGANLLYQVDNTPYSGTQPLFKLIMTEAERQELASLGVPGSASQNTDADMNGTFISVDSTGTEVRYAIGIRNRGGGSRDAPPNNYRIDFNSDNAWKDTTALNLNGRYSMEEVIGSAVFQYAGLQAQVGVPAQVRVNNSNLAGATFDMFGSYSAMESEDSDFVNVHYPLDDQGNYYRGVSATHLSNLAYLGTDPDLYRPYYSKQNNTEIDDWTDLINLTKAFDTTQTPDAVFATQIQNTIDVPEWLKYFAVSTLIGTQETTLSTGFGDDFSLYRGVNDPRFEVIVHDLDTILGRGDTAAVLTESIFRAANLPTISRLLKNPTFAPQYFAAILNQINTTFAPANIEPLIDNILGGYTTAAVRQTMKTFVTNRMANVRTQIPLKATATSALTVQNGYPRTIGTTANLSGLSNAIKTRSVLVNGVAATWSAWQAQWTATNVALQPGINRILVQSLDENGVEFDRTYIDIWRDVPATTVSGTLPVGVTHWTTGTGPYRVTASLTVPSGATLQIDPGVTVFFDANTSLTVSGTGRIDARGTDLQRIRFTKTPGANAWTGLIISSQQDNQLTYLDQEFSGSGTLNISLNNAVANIDHVAWLNTTTRILDIGNTSFKLTNSTIPATVNVQPIDYHTAFPAGGYAIIQGNTFGKATGQNDVIDFTGGNRPGSIVQILDNTFLGSEDDILDLDGTDAHIEGNVFMNVHLTNLTNPDTASAISGGKDGSNTSEWTIVRNYFYDCDQAILAKEGTFATIINNTFVRMVYSAINFDEPLRAGIVPGKGAYLDGNIVWDTPQIFGNVNSDGTTTDITVRHSILQTATVYPGIGNSNLDPQLVQTIGVTDPRTQLVLRSGPGPAVGTGPNGRDMGASVPAGASIAGEPASPTWRATATLTVGGPEIYAYQYRVNGGAWSATVSVTNPGLATAVVPPIVLSGLTNGTYTVQVIAKNDAGVWQSIANATTSRTWTVNTALAPHVRINEVLADNDTALVVNGSKPDLIELYNDGPTSVDISGMAITDTAGNRKFTFPAGTIINAGEYRVLYGDAATSPPGTKLNFSFKAGGEGVFLYDTLANGGGLLDGVVFGNQLTDRSLARRDDGTWTLGIPTFGSANVFATLADPHLLKINEWFTSGSGSDFIELYNPSTLPVDVGNYFLSDDPISQPNRQQITPYYFIAGSGKSVFIADDTPASGPDHLGFKLGYENGQIALFDPSLARVDDIVYGTQQSNKSQGRSGNGAPLFQFTTANAGADNPVSTTTLVNLRDEWNYFQSGAPAAGWNGVADPSPNWNLRGGGLLYAATNTLPGPKTTPLTLTSGRISYYFRKHFTLNADPSTVQLTLNTVLDDSAVIYLNGHEVFRLGLPDAPATITDTTPANRTVSDAAFEGQFTIPSTWLVNGDNVLAVEVHQSAGTSTDVVWGMTLDVTITAAPPPALRISEINYNPYPPPSGSPYTADDFEFIEIVNTGATTVNLQNAKLASAVDFTFPNANVAPGQRVLVVKNLAAFSSRYNTAGLTILGQYSGTLSDSSDDVVLFDKLNQVIDKVDYNNDDPWPSRPAGSGSTLELIDTSLPAVDPTSWRASYEFGGTPGTAGAGAVNRVVVNEVLTHTDLPQRDAIELYNTTGAPINIGGWYLSDSNNNYKKYRIPTGTIIAASQYLVFDETAFNAAAPVGTDVPFRLSANGEDVWLTSADGSGNLTAFEDHVEFGAAINGESFGRWTDGSGELYPMKTLTLGSHNSGPRIDSVDISEIMYNPAGGNADLEFVELKNLTNQTVVLSNTFAGVGTVPWKIDGIGFEFPIGTTIAPGGTLVVVRFNPNSPADANKLADFRAAYGIGPEVQLVGPYSGQLDNAGERIRLLRPDEPNADDPDTIPYLLVDEVNYDNSAPWPTSPSTQNGNSLTRNEALVYGDDPANWIGAPATPGNSSLFAPTIVAGDFDLNGVRNSADIAAMLRSLTNQATYQSTNNVSNAALAYIGDLTGDGAATNRDIQTLLALIAAAEQTGGGSVSNESPAANSQPATPPAPTAAATDSVPVVVETTHTSDSQIVAAPVIAPRVESKPASAHAADFLVPAAIDQLLAHSADDLRSSPAPHINASASSVFGPRPTPTINIVASLADQIRDRPLDSRKPLSTVKTLKPSFDEGFAESLSQSLKRKT